LPLSFTGSARHLKRNYYEAMTVVKEHGHPALFTSMLCNSDWPEIRNSLHCHQHSTDRPAIVSRVFFHKIKILLTDIVDKQFFGPVRACFWVVEFQKKGLPRMHLTVNLKNEEDKPNTPKKLNPIVST